MADTSLLKFVDREQAYPAKREPEIRAEDFREIAERYAAPEAEDQAGRCSQCGVPYCSVHCPLHNHIPDWLRLTAEGRLREAYELSNSTSTMPEICGRICPQDRLCEGNCVIEFSGHGAVTIGSVEKFITDTAWEEGWVEPLVPGTPRGQSVGVIGAGPAGLSAAEYLRVNGYDVHVYDRYDRAGGLLTYGIPGFKLEKPVVMRRVDRLKAGGIVFHENFEVGRDATLDELRQRHDAVLIATGVYRARAIKAPGVEKTGVVDALAFLTASNRKNFGDAVPAFDDRANMPGSQREVNNAEEEGVEFVWLSAPESFTGGEAVGGVKASGMRLGAPDASGRRAPEIDPQGGSDLPADLVIKALGFDAEDLPKLFGAPELGTTRWGTVLVDNKTLMTSLDGVFAAGDIVRGASLVVWAIRDGRDVAASMHKYLKAKASAGRKAA